MKIEIDTDTASAVIKRATDVLFLQNPIGTSMGLLIGVICNGLESPLSKATNIDLMGVNAFVWLAAGVVVCNLPSLFRSNPLPAPVETALGAIRKARKEGEISQAQARLMYVALYEKVLSEVTLDSRAREAVRQASKKADA
jgi:hypothetical protein